jgi:hypothetical protein
LSFRLQGAISRSNRATATGLAASPSVDAGFGRLPGQYRSRGAGAKLTSLLRAQAVTFEVDEIDEAARSGWSVIVSGRAEEVVRPDALAHVEALGLESWVPADLPTSSACEPRWYRVGGSPAPDP